MANRSCTTCVYAYWDPGQWLASLSSGFPSRPICANHSDSPGLMKPVPFGDVCRNYRPKPPEPDKAAKRIPLSDGLYAYVDAADYEWLSQYPWRLYGGYAARMEKNRTFCMHREIVKPPKDKMVDHINQNKLDNSRPNLRFCTRQQNAQNNRKRRGALSRFEGVGYEKRAGKWFASVHVNGKDIWLGYHTDEIEAARAYDRAAVGRFGEYANLNFPEEWPPERRQEIYAQYPRRGESSFARAPVRPQRAKGKKVGSKEGKGDTRSGKRKRQAKKPNNRKSAGPR
jgi:hypothetical protein